MARHILYILYHANRPMENEIVKKTEKKVELKKNNAVP